MFTVSRLHRRIPPTVPFLVVALLFLTPFLKAQSFFMEYDLSLDEQKSVLRPLSTMSGAQIHSGYGIDATFDDVAFLAVSRYAQVQPSVFTPSFNWTRHYSESGLEKFHDARETADGQIVAAGSLSFQPWIVKVDAANGNILWQRELNEFGEFFTVVALPDGFAAGGIVDADLLAARFDLNGNMQWTGRYGWPGTNEQAFSIRAHPAGGLLVGGETTQFETSGLSNLFAMHLDDNGNPTWSNIFGNPTETEGLQAQMDVLPSGAAVFVGEQNYSSPFEDNALVARIDADGDLEWIQSLDLATDETRGVAGTTDDGCLVISSTTGVGGRDLWLARLDPAGAVLWERLIGGDLDDLSHSVDVTPYGGILLGATGNDGLFNLSGLGHRLEADGTSADPGCTSVSTVNSVQQFHSVQENRTLPPFDLTSMQVLTSQATTGTPLSTTTVDCVACQVNVQLFGQGAFGSGGFVPVLSGTGGLCDQTGGRVLDITQGLGGTRGMLLVGISQWNLPIFGGTLYVDLGQPWIFLNVKLNGTPGAPGLGSWQHVSTSELRSYVGLELFFQALLTDPGAAKNFAMTNGLRWTIGN